MSDVERSTVTGGQHLLLISPAHTVSPELPGLTPGDLLPQPQELLCPLDILDGGEGVVPLPLQLYWHRIWQRFHSLFHFELDASY